MGKGYKYHVEDEKLRQYMKLSTEEKLKWLHEVREFMEIVMDDKAKKIREMFRKGEI